MPEVTGWKEGAVSGFGRAVGQEHELTSVCRAVCREESDGCRAEVLLNWY
jgi:hypothetical protein